jgi:hypothetical protein
MHVDARNQPIVPTVMAVMPNEGLINLRHKHELKPPFVCVSSM